MERHGATIPGLTLEKPETQRHQRVQTETEKPQWKPALSSQKVRKHGLARRKAGENQALPQPPPNGPQHQQKRKRGAWTSTPLRLKGGFPNQCPLSLISVRKGQVGKPDLHSRQVVMGPLSPPHWEDVGGGQVRGR